MVSKLTLSVDERLVRLAKEYAARHGVSVSKLVSQYFERLKLADVNHSELVPGQRLRALLDAGPIELPEDFDYKQALYESAK